MDPELQAIIESSTISHFLTPIDVLKLFERIPEEDIPLLAMDSKRYVNFNQKVPIFELTDLRDCLCLQLRFHEILYYL